MTIAPYGEGGKKIGKIICRERDWLGKRDGGGALSVVFERERVARHSWRGGEGKRCRCPPSRQKGKEVGGGKKVDSPSIFRTAGKGGMHSCQHAP